MKSPRGRAWAPVALIAVLASLLHSATAAAAPGDLPDIAQERPDNVAGGYFDDHSISGDNHLAWGAGASQSEPLAVTFTTRLVNRGAGALEVCGYPAAGGWMRAYQVAPGALGNDCPSAPAYGTPPAGWFRYVTANHAGDGAYNRWHLMDLQRFALVPLPPDQGGPAGAATAWDTAWGACLNLGDPSMYCATDTAASALSVGIGSGTAKVVQDGAPDGQMIAIPAESRFSFPDGAYQLVAISNPYGALAEAGPTSGSVACTAVQLANAPAYTGFTATASAAVPTTCWVPRTLPAALTGPGGRDPMAGAAPTMPACTLMPASGHCWATPPATGDNPPARTNVTAATAVSATDLVPVPQGNDYRVTPVPAPPAATAATRRLTARGSRTFVRRALRREFGRNLRRLRVSCRVVSSSRSTCTVRWRRAGASYRGRVFLRLRTVRGALRWQYRVDVTKRREGRAHRIRRSYKTGGVL